MNKSFDITSNRIRLSKDIDASFEIPEEYFTHFEHRVMQSVSPDFQVPEGYFYTLEDRLTSQALSSSSSSFGAWFSIAAVAIVLLVSGLIASTYFHAVESTPFIPPKPVAITDPGYSEDDQDAIEQLAQQIDYETEEIVMLSPATLFVDEYSVFEAIEVSAYEDEEMIASTLSEISSESIENYLIEEDIPLDILIDITVTL